MDGSERMKILLLEDDKQASRYVARGLTEEGHVVDVAGNAALATDMIHVSAYDILIVDRMLPGLDGLSFVKQIRREGCKARVLFLTALGGATLICAPKSAGWRARSRTSPACAPRSRASRPASAP